MFTATTAESYTVFCILCGMYEKENNELPEEKDQPSELVNLKWKNRKRKQSHSCLTW